MDYLTELKCLSDKFVTDYPHNIYPEIMYKSNRAYNCILIDTHKEYYICVPYRSNIQHNNAYLFKGTRRSQQTRSGIDFSKMVIITDKAYFQDKAPTIDEDEYRQTEMHMREIVDKAIDYLNDYISHKNKTKILDEKEYKRKYGFSSLPYFDDKLGIEEKHT